MNYYEHHIGDYAEATSHLSFVEDAAYSRLIRKYYSTERPIPADINAAQRIVGARTKEEREAVETVLREFFELRDDGWHQRVCDENIAAYLAGEPEREAKRKNEDTRLARHRAERAELFGVINAAGLHASWNIKIDELRKLAASVTGQNATPATAPETLQVGKTETPATQPATAPATPATATQTPIPNTQTPDTRGKEKIPPASRSARKPSPTDLPADFAVSARVRDWAARNNVGQLDRRLEAFVSKVRAKGYRYVDWDEAFMGAIRDGWARPAVGEHGENKQAALEERNRAAVEQALREVDHARI